MSRTRTMRVAWTAAAALAAACAMGAHAHAFLDHAAPRVGATIDRSPPQVTLWFTEPLEPAFSKVQVLDANGREVDAKDGAVDAKDRTTMHVTIPALAPGRYRVKWRVLSVDTHVTDGDFTFEVRR